MINWHMLNWVDYSILSLITLSMLISFIRGFTKELISIISWVLALWVAIHFSPIIAKNIGSHWIASESLRWMIVLCILFFAILIAGAACNYVISTSVTRIGLKPVDRVLGLGFGLFRGFLLITFLLLITSLTDWSEQQPWKQSLLIPNFIPAITWIKKHFPKQVKRISSFQQKAESQENDLQENTL